MPFLLHYGREAFLTILVDSFPLALAISLFRVSFSLLSLAISLSESTKSSNGINVCALSVTTETCFQVYSLQFPPRLPLMHKQSFSRFYPLQILLHALEGIMTTCAFGMDAHPFQPNISYLLMAFICFHLIFGHIYYVYSAKGYHLILFLHGKCYNYLLCYKRHKDAVVLRWTIHRPSVYSTISFCSSLVI